MLTANATLLSGDAEAGRQIYDRCVGCHSPERNRTGPRHCGLFGRVAGSVSGFAYSDAMQRSEITWSAETLDRFLESPVTFMPGTSMAFFGIKDPRLRNNLIAYLEDLSNSPKVCEL